MSDNYELDAIQCVIDGGPAQNETWFRLQISGATTSKHLNITRKDLETIRDIISNKHKDNNNE